MRMTEWFGELVRDITYSLRGFARRPGWTLLALATVVLGVGSLTAAYALLHHVVLRPLPFEDMDRLVTVRTSYDGDAFGVTTAEFEQLVEHADAFESLAALVEPALDEELTWSAGEERRPLAGVQVTDGFFSTLGVSAEIGSAVGSGDSGERRLVVSHDFWQSALGGDREAVGRALRINAEPYVVAGVLPASFEFPLGGPPPEAWVLFTPPPVEVYRGMPLMYRPVGRLAPGVGPGTATAQVIRLVEDFRATLSYDPGATFVRSLEEDLVGSVRQPLLLLTVAGALVLLVAAVNLSLLVGVRNVERREELNVRTALGAGRGRLLQQLLVEAGLLATIGGSVALVGASFVLERAARTGLEGFERLPSGPELGPGVILVGLAAAIAPALLAAALPAFRVVTSARGLGSRGASTSLQGQRFTWTLAAVESCAVFTLLVAALLVVRSLDEVMAVEPGFDTTSTVALTVFVPQDRYPPWTRESAEFVVSLQDRLEAVPGVVAAGAISNLPLSAESWSGSLEIEGRDDVGVGGAVVVDWELVSPGYFEAMGIPLSVGRGFDTRDRAGEESVVIVNESLAGRWWPDGEALGARMSGGGTMRSIVGVVGDVKQQGLHVSTRGFMYLPILQVGAGPRQEVVVRAASDDPVSVVAEVRTALLEFEPGLAFGSVRTLHDVMKGSSGAFRLRAVLLSAFAAMALLLGMSGIYGITAHGVRMRRRDIGIRMAVGADGDRIMAGVFGEALLPVVTGLGVGLVVVLLVGSAVRGMLYGVDPNDPTSLVTVAALLIAAAAAAVAPSAVRARRVDPARMLRSE